MAAPGRRWSLARTGPKAARAREDLAQDRRRSHRDGAATSSSSSTKTTCRCGTRSRRSRPSIYGASDITADAKVRGQIKQLQEDGYGHYPVCVAKTQYSFSTDPESARRAARPHRQHPRGAPCRGRRVRRDDLRRHHDDAGPAEGAVRRTNRSHRRRQSRRAVLKAHKAARSLVILRLI